MFVCNNTWLLHIIIHDKLFKNPMIHKELMGWWVKECTFGDRIFFLDGDQTSSASLPAT